MSYYIVKRGPKPSYHNAPFHPVIVCNRKPVAMWEAGNTAKRSWVFVSDDPHHGHGWLIVRWEGLDIDYKPVVSGGFTLPDGTEPGFHHKLRHPETWDLLKGAVWWSKSKLPDWLADMGVVEAPDEWTKETIKQDYGYCER